MRISKHARIRMQQRGVSTADIESILDFARLRYRSGRKSQVAFIRRRDIPRGSRSLPQMERLRGLILVLSLDGVIVTVYRTRRPNKILRGQG